LLLRLAAIGTDYEEQLTDSPLAQSGAGWA
jgi:hypothetical protein